MLSHIVLSCSMLDSMWGWASIYLCQDVWTTAPLVWQVFFRFESSVSGVFCRLLSLMFCVRVRVFRLVALCFVLSGVSLCVCALISFVPGRSIAARFLQSCVVFPSPVWRFARLILDRHIAFFSQIVLFASLVSWYNVFCLRAWSLGVTCFVCCDLALFDCLCASRRPSLCFERCVFFQMCLFFRFSIARVVACLMCRDS